MYIDLLCSDNYIQFNIKAAQMFGLNTAVYWAELLNIIKKAHKKNKISEDGFFKIDRKYIFERTSLSVEDQLHCDKVLSNVKVLQEDENSNDLIRMNIQLMASIIANDDAKLTTDIVKKANIKTKKEAKTSQRQAIINNLKNGIVEPDYELLTALRDWVDGVYANPKGYLSNKIIEIFQATLNEYAKDNKELKLRLIQIATTQGYREASFAINIYERDNKMKSNMENKVRTTEQKTGRSSDISDISF